MCVSAVVETDRQRIATLIGLSRLTAVDGPGDGNDGSRSDGSADAQLPRRIEARTYAWVVREASGGRLVVEPMAFNPYVVRRRNLQGDMWASSLLAANHGLVILRSFSEWISAELLLGLGLIGVHDANCAFNRVAPSPQPGGRGPQGRLLLANFTPQGSVLVPVLFDGGRDSRPPDLHREFVLITDEPPEDLHMTGVAQAPVGLTVEAALEWLHIGSGEESIAIDFEEVLEDGKAESYAFSLYKSA
jgi:hypothetical protein